RFLFYGAKKMEKIIPVICFFLIALLVLRRKRFERSMLILTFGFIMTSFALIHSKITSGVIGMYILICMVLFLMIIFYLSYDNHYRSAIKGDLESQGLEILELRRARPSEKGPFSRYPPDSQFIYIVVVRSKTGETFKGWVRGDTGDTRWGGDTV